jgi:hypothetical protein
VLSVFSTLKEMLFLWVRNFWYLVILVLVIETPLLVCSHLTHIPVLKAHTGPGPFLATILLFGSVLLGSVKTAAILGLLRKESLGKTFVAAVGSSIHQHTWTLLRLMLLIALTFIPFALLISIIVRLMGANKFMVVFAMGFYLVLIKYALAYPLVVVENLNAKDALVQSWKMTKGHFRYVLGCYLFLWLGQWLINWRLPWNLNGSSSGLGWDHIPLQLGVALLEPMWIILSWSMYLRIKEVDAPNLISAPAP